MSQAINYSTIEAIHNNAVNKGFWPQAKITSIEQPDQMDFVVRLLALIHSEVSEALEVLRKCPAGDIHWCFGEELADVVIRTFDLAEGMGIPIIAAVLRKVENNACRPFKHGCRF